MNRDVKIGLAIGLLLLVGLFVWFAWKASRGQPQVGDVAKNEAQKVAPDKTSSGDVSAGDYFGGDNGTAGAPKDVASIEMGKDAAPAPKEDLTPEGKKYLELAKKSGPGAVGPIAKVTPKPLDTTGDATPSTYVVKKGDYLSTISKKVYGSVRYWEKIAQANNIDPKGLKVGMSLKIPPLSDDEKGKISGKATAMVKDTAPVGDHVTHKVVKGDTLEGISKKYFGNIRHVKDIMEANKLDNAHMLRVGSTLVIPKGSSTAPSVAVGPTSALPTPLPLPAPVPVVADAKKEYVVKEGDTLDTISKRFYGTTKYYLLIMRANNLDDVRSVRIGTKLVIPDKPETGATAVLPVSDAVAPKLASGEKRYTVREGDTIAIIAASELGNSLYSNEIMKRNSLSEADPLKPGQVLVLPSASTLRTLSAVSARPE